MNNQIIEKINPKAMALKFKNMMQEGFSQVSAACKIYVSIVDQSAVDAQIFRDEIPEIPTGAWNRYESVGRSALHPNLLAWRTCEGIKRLEKLPFSDQAKYSEENIEVLTSSGDKLSVSIQNLTKDQAEQVFANDHVRDLAGQKAYLESLKTKRKREMELKDSSPKVYHKPWKVISRNIIEINGVKFQRKDVVGMLSEMEA